MTGAKEKVLFVGAGGAVASKAIPELAATYDIVGIAGRRRDLERYCIEFASAELTGGAPRIFEELCSRHAFRSIVWNAVRYHPGPLLATSRGALHFEFDIGIALPLECLRAALASGFGNGATFVTVTSGLAFGMKPSWGSYAIVKRGQVIMTDYLAEELAGRGIHPKAVALGAIADVPAPTLREVFERAIDNADPGKTLYKAYGPDWE